MRGIKIYSVPTLCLKNTYILLCVFCLRLPLFHCFFPISSLSAGNGFCLLASLVASFVACPLCSHISNGSFVKNNDSPTTYCIMQFFLSKGFTWLIKIGNIEFVIYTQVVAHKFLLIAVSRIFKS